MSRNPRDPSQPAGDNPAGNTLGQTHGFYSESHSNPELAMDPGRPPVMMQTTTISSRGQMAMQAISTQDTLVSEPISSISEPFVRGGAVVHSPEPTTSVMQ